MPQMAHKIFYGLSLVGVFALFALAIVFGSPLWRPHMFNLFSQSWRELMRAFSNSSLGFVLFNIALPLVVGILSAFYSRYFEKNPWLEASKRASIAALVALFATFILTGGAYIWTLVSVAYESHESLVRSKTELLRSNTKMEEEIRNNKHFMDVLQAFTVYRLRIAVKNYSSCQIKTTAPNETQSKATMVSQMASMATQCPTYGPMDSNMSPEVREETENGMVDGIVIFHARKGDKAADELYGILGSTLPLRRSYEVPPRVSEHFLWLQYGKNVKWNSER